MERWKEGFAIVMCFFCLIVVTSAYVNEVDYGMVIVKIKYNTFSFFFFLLTKSFFKGVMIDGGSSGSRIYLYGKKQYKQVKKVV